MFAKYHSSTALFIFALAAIQLFRNHILIKVYYEDDASAASESKWSKQKITPDKDFLLLNITTARQMRAMARSHLSPYSIDVLIVGSMFKTTAAREQFATWGSHT